MCRQVAISILQIEIYNFTLFPAGTTNSVKNSMGVCHRDCVSWSCGQPVPYIFATLIIPRRLDKFCGCESGFNFQTSKDTEFFYCLVFRLLNHSSKMLKFISKFWIFWFYENNFEFPVEFISQKYYCEILPNVCKCSQNWILLS